MLLGLVALNFVWWFWRHDWNVKELTTRISEIQISRGPVEVDFSGTYLLRGPGYSGTVHVKKTGEGYNLRYMLTDSTCYYGNGLAYGEVLAVVYEVHGRGQGRLAAYKKTDGGLTGLTAWMDSDKLRVEKCVDTEKIESARLPLAGTYTLDGKHPNQAEYSGKMTLERTGSTYTVEWLMADSSHYYGTAFAVDSVVVTGYASKSGVGVAIYHIDGGKLEGSWCYTDYVRLATTSDIRAGSETAANRRLKKKEVEPEPADTAGTDVSETPAENL